MKKIMIGMETNRAKFFDNWILVQTANQYYFLKKVLLGGLQVILAASLLLEIIQKIAKIA